LAPSKDYDVIVIGAGVLGAASAYHLKKNNPSKDILMLDMYSGVAQGNTGRSNAMFRNTFSSYDNQVLSDCAINFYLDLQSSGSNVGLRQTGYLWLLSEKELRTFGRHIARMLDAGIQTKKYDRRELEVALPTLRTRLAESEEASLMHLPDIEAGFFGAKCGQIDPVALTSQYEREFERLGGRTAFDSFVDNLLAAPHHPLGVDGEPFVWQESAISGVRVSGRVEGELRAKTTVIAAGAWTNRLLEPLGIDGHIKAKKRQLFKVQVSSDPALKKLLRSDAFNALKTLPFVILPETGCFVKAIAESNEFWLGCDDDFNQPFINIPSRNLDEFTAELSYYENNVHRILSEYFTEFKDKMPSNMWAGLYSYNTLDNMPFVFAEKGAIVVGGDSGSGIMKADSLGRIVDAIYRDGEEAQAELYGGLKYAASKLGFSRRSVEHEEWVI
jgi:FAD-dependent oxidoreductase domain-containing protein 1